MLSPDQLKSIYEAVAAGRQIEAVRAYQEATGESADNAMAYVEELARHLNGQGAAPVQPSASPLGSAAPLPEPFSTVPPAPAAAPADVLHPEPFSSSAPAPVKEPFADAPTPAAEPLASMQPLASPEPLTPDMTAAPSPPVLEAAKPASPGTPSPVSPDGVPIPIRVVPHPETARPPRMPTFQPLPEFPTATPSRPAPDPATYGFRTSVDEPSGLSEQVAAGGASAISEPVAPANDASAFGLDVGAPEMAHIRGMSPQDSLALLNAIRGGYTIQAIRVLRMSTGLGLREARDVVDRLAGAIRAGDVRAGVPGEGRLAPRSTPPYRILPRPGAAGTQDPARAVLIVLFVVFLLAPMLLMMLLMGLRVMH